MQEALRGEASAQAVAAAARLRDVQLESEAQSRALRAEIERLKALQEEAATGSSCQVEALQVCCVVSLTDRLQMMWFSALLQCCVMAIWGNGRASLTWTVQGCHRLSAATSLSLSMSLSCTVLLM